jgi:hypothetical protein
MQQCALPGHGGSLQLALVVAEGPGRGRVPAAALGPTGLRGDAPLAAVAPGVVVVGARVGGHIQGRVPLVVAPRLGDREGMGVSSGSGEWARWCARRLPMQGQPLTHYMCLFSRPHAHHICLSSQGPTPMTVQGVQGHCGDSLAERDAGCCGQLQHRRNSTRCRITKELAHLG